MRNLPAFATVRKAGLALLWGGGALGYLAAVWIYGPAAQTPTPQVERDGGSVAGSPLWPGACVPVVASRRGKRYYYAWCEGAGSLKPQNLAHFCGAAAAERAGFTLADGCGGEAAGGSEPRS